MAVTDLLAITQVAQNQNNKYVTINDADRALEQATQKTLVDAAVGAGPRVLTESEFTRNVRFALSGASGAFQVTIPALIQGTETTNRLFVVANLDTTYICTVSHGSGATVAVDPGTAALVYSDGTDITAIASGGGSASAIDWKESVVAASTANGTLASDFENGDTMDTVTLSTGDRILLKDQSTGSENGVYIVQASGAPVRATDFDDDAEVTPGAAVYVEEGSANATRLFFMTTTGTITVGTTSLTFAELSGGGGGSTTFTGLTDTPANYTGSAGKVARVNVTPNAIEFAHDLESQGQKLEVALNAGNVTLTEDQYLGNFFFTPDAAVTNANRILTVPATSDTNGKFFAVENPSGSSEVFDVAQGLFDINVVPGEAALFYADGTTSDLRKVATNNVSSGATIVDWKDSVVAASTAAGTLATDFENGDTLDGVTLTTGDRILLKDQAAGAENGVYTVNVSGAPTRAVDFDEDSEATTGAAVYVEEGTVNGSNLFFLTTTGTITVGTTALTFSLFTGAGVATFVALTDGPGAFSGNVGKIVNVNAGATALEYNYDAPGARDTHVEAINTANQTLAAAEFGPHVHFAPDANVSNAGRTLTIDAAITDAKLFYVENLAGSTESFDVVRGTTSIDVRPGETLTLYTDGTANDLTEFASSREDGNQNWKEPVRVATTVDGTLASAYENGDTVDGITIATGDRILLKDQSTGSQNGVYIVQASGAPVRATDFDESHEVTTGATIYVTEGTVNGNTVQVLTTVGAINIGVSSMTFSNFKLKPTIELGDFIGGVPATSTILFRHLAAGAEDYPADLLGTVGHAGTGPSAQTDFDVQKNGVSVGTIRFASAATTSTNLTNPAFSLAVGDRLDIVSPANLNTLADFSFTIVGTAV